MITEGEMLRRIQAALPPGKAWTRDPNANLTKLLKGCGNPLAAAYNAAEAALVDELDPSLTTNLIEEWEALTRPYGDEDPPAAIEDRRASVVRKLAMNNGCTLDDLDAMYAAFGYVATTTVFREVLRVGFRVGDRCFSNHWRSIIFVTAPADTAENDARFEAALQSIVQAHVQLFMIWT